MRMCNNKHVEDLLEKVSEFVCAQLLSNLFSICTSYSVLQSVTTAFRDPSTLENNCHDELAFVNLTNQNTF